jgi:hypothetical protein
MDGPILTHVPTATSPQKAIRTRARRWGLVSQGLCGLSPVLRDPLQGPFAFSGSLPLATSTDCTYFTHYSDWYRRRADTLQMWTATQQYCQHCPSDARLARMDKWSGKD